MTVLKDAKIYEELRSQILRNKFRPGGRLVEEDICRQLGVTRTPVRHALKRLEQEGLVINEPYCGCRIREITLLEASEYFDVREVLEGLAARNVAKANSSEDISELNRLAGVVDDAAFADDWSRYFEADRYFHETLVQLSKNQKLIEIMTISSFLLRSFALYDRYLLDIVGRLRELEVEGIYTHRSLAASLAGGDPDRAEEAVRKHIYMAKELMEHSAKRGNP
jgi:DNA-binding GntR family transcriptional regulator